MSENNSLNEQVEITVEDATVMTVPIDDTLSVSGEAADAKAVGDALALKADASSVVTIKVNGEEPDNQGLILINGEDIPMSESDDTTLKAKITAVDGKTGADIPVSSAAGAQTVQAAVEAAANKTANDIPMAANSGTTISAKISAMDVVTGANSDAITALQGKAGDTIKLHSDEDETIAEAVDGCVRSVNGEGPDASGNVQVQHALTADDLTSAKSQAISGEFARRTTAGGTPIETGKAYASIIRGNRSRVGYIAESLTWNLYTAPREQGQDPITITLDRDTFVAYVEDSGIISLTYTTSWSANPALYGVTVAGTPVSGDQITINYTKENRGTIIMSNPKTLIATGWNLAKATSEYTGYTHLAIALKYDTTATFKIIGTYTGVYFAATLTGEKTTITPSDGIFTVSSNGYIFVAGGSTDTAVYMTWTDWILDGPTVAEEYTESVIDMSVLFDGDQEQGIDAFFPYGLLRAGNVRDEINFNTGRAISKIERLAYSAENLAAAEETGREYEYDTNYIYLERETAETQDIEISGEYDVDDHGLEYFTDTSIAVYAVMIYGNSLKNKLESDVLTISTQSLTNNQKTQVQTNIGAASQASVTSISDKMSALIPQKLIHSDAGLTHTLRLPSNGRGFIVGSCSVSSGHFLIIFNSSTSSVSFGEVYKGSGVTFSTSGLELTVTISASREYFFYVMIDDPSKVDDVELVTNLQT